MQRLVPAVLATALLAIVRAPWPDDWDGVGFVLAVRDFDLAAFRPHFPGYPVYVALSRLLNAVSASPALAASLASCVGGGLLVFGVGACLTNSRRSSWCALAIVASPLVALAATSVGSDALGLGLLALGIACLVRSTRGPAWALCAGIAMGLALGARPSNLFVACVAAAIAVLTLDRAVNPRVSVQRALALAGIGLVFALIPSVAALVLRHGVDELGRLGRAQIGGHFTEWGGTAVTQSDLASRVVQLAHSVLADGLGIGLSLAGAVRAVLIAALVARGAAAAPRRIAIGAVVGVAIVAAYLAIAQNVTQPRHALPIVCVVLAFAAHGLAVTAAAGARGIALATALIVGGLAWPTAELVWLHHREPPPGLAAAMWIRAQGPSRDAVLFGGRAARFGELLSVPTFPRTWMGEIEVTLERLDRLPPRIYLTDEVRFRERARGRLTWQRTFCRDTRIERGPACVALYRYEPAL